MTGYDAPPAAGGGAAERPPLPLDLLADLHAGVLDDDYAAELRRQVATDPDAQATLAALDATSATLADLPPLTIPADVAARIDAAIRAEATARATTTLTAPPPPARPAAPAPSRAPAGPTGSAAPMAPVVDLAARRRRHGLFVAGGLLTTAAAVIGVIAVSGLPGGETDGNPAPGASGPSNPELPPLAVSADKLGDAFADTMSVTDYGPLGAPGRLSACLSAIHVDPADKPLGAREVTLDDTPGVLLILPTGKAGSFRLVVVEPECGPGRSKTLADTTIGR